MSEAYRSCSPMRCAANALADIVMKDPAVATVGMSLGANGTQTQKQWPPLHHPEPRDQRDLSADQAIRRLLISAGKR